MAWHMATLHCGLTSPPARICDGSVPEISPQRFLYPGILVVLTVRNVASILAYPLLLIMLKEASPSPSNLGKINGLAASAAVGCHPLYLDTCIVLELVKASMGWQGGEVEWLLLSALPKLFRVGIERHKTTSVRSGAPCITSSKPREYMKAVIYIEVNAVGLR